MVSEPRIFPDYRALKTKATILVVEDDTAVAGLISEFLSAAGAAVEMVHSGRSCMPVATARKFDLILLDIDLPDISGFEICRELKQRHIACRTPIVFMSGNVSTERRQMAFELGALDFIAKPFQMDDFLERIASYFSSARCDEPSTKSKFSGQITM
jgi:DNA-binding response OmpR family regulator